MIEVQIKCLAACKAKCMYVTAGMAKYYDSLQEEMA